MTPPATATARRTAATTKQQPLGTPADAGPAPLSGPPADATRKPGETEQVVVAWSAPRGQGCWLGAEGFTWSAPSGRESGTASSGGKVLHGPLRPGARSGPVGAKRARGRSGRPDGADQCHSSAPGQHNGPRRSWPKASEQGAKARSSARRYGGIRRAADRDGASLRHVGADGEQQVASGSPFCGTRRASEGVGAALAGAHAGEAVHPGDPDLPCAAGGARGGTQDDVDDVLGVRVLDDDL